MSIFLLAFTIPPCLDVLYWTCRLTGFVPAQITGFSRSIVVWEGHGFSRAASVQTSEGFSPVVRSTLAQSRRPLKSAMIFEIKYPKYTLFRPRPAVDSKLVRFRP